MSLQLWMPLTKDLRQQGVSGITPTQTTGYTSVAAGKLGGCYKFTGTFDTLLPLSNWNWTEGSISFGCWAKISQSELATLVNAASYDATYNSMGGTLLGRDSYGGLGLRWKTNNIYSSSTLSAVYIYVHIRNTSSSSNNTSTYTIPFDTWFHVMTVIDRTENKIKVYINGELFTSTNLTVTGTFTTGTFRIAEATWDGGNGRSSAGCWQLNDVRVYDHALSQMEIKELAKGLVLHYPLNRQGLGPSNLLKNGFGELGSENWSNSTNISTTDIPADHPEIYASFSGSTVERMKIYPSHTYKFSTWIKGTTTSGNTYPSLYPYDVDGKFIDYYKCPNGFNLNTMTTLKQQLTTGDTKIYVNDLSQWNANSGHYYNWAAIFSYTDSTGYTYPDGAYTQNLGRFGSSTNAKTNLDKTNNIITLTTAYTGPTMPAGTKVCASTEGSTYFYPLGGISLASIQDWTYKEGTFSGNDGRLRYAKTVTFATYSNNRMAGIKLEDVTANNLTGTTEYDCSGYCNNGTRTGTFTWTSDTSKYNVSQTFNGSDNAIQTPNLTTMISDKTYSIACWFKKSSIGTKNYQTIYGGPSGFELEARNGSGTSPQVVAWNWGKPLANYTFDTWNHFVFVHTDGDCKIYLNGEYVSTGSSATIPSGNYFVGAWSNSGAQNYEGLMSDFRIYATALSADDVKSLYQNCATIGSDGTIYGQIRN